MTEHRHAQFARRFGVTNADAGLPEPIGAATFTKIHNGRSYGYNMTGPKWRCDVCGRDGYGPPDRDLPYSWAEGCQRGHSPCTWCGRQLAVRKDGTPRVHARCPKRPTDAEVLRLATAEAREVARCGIRGPMGRDATALLDRLTMPTHVPGATK